MGGGTTLSRILLSSLILILSATSVLAYEEGDTVHYTSRVDSSNAVIFNVDGNKGFCCETGVAEAESGTGTIDQISSTSRLAKTMAYIARKGWDDRDGIDSTSGLPWKLVCQGMVQYAVEGQAAADFWQTGTGGNWPDVTVNALIGYVEEAQGETLPRGFKVFTVDAGNHQNFAVFYIDDTGELTVKKVSTGNQSQTFTFTVKVAGANGTYSGVSFNNGTATITLRGGQSKTIEGLPADASYTVTETNIPSGWRLVSKTGDSGTIESGSTVTATFNNKQAGKLNLRKGSSNTSITG